MRWECDLFAISQNYVRIRASPVIRVLMETSQVKDAGDFAEAAKEEGKTFDPSSLFIGTRVHLADTSDVFFIVMGRTTSLTGADNDWFWIVRQSGNRGRVLLFVGTTCIKIRPAKTFGYDDITATWYSASYIVTDTYKFNGKSYALRGTKYEQRN